MINAVNFKKGCYTGQEIVARTHYLGKPKRRMYLGSVKVNSLPMLADEILVQGEKVGQIINFYKKSEGHYRILFELIIEKINLELILADTNAIIKEIT